MINYLKRPVINDEGKPTIINGKVMTNWSAIWRSAVAVGVGLLAFKGLLMLMGIAAVLDSIN